MRVVYYVAASLDGYIARLDGDVSWLDDLDIPMEATGYNEFFADIDGLIMGRKTRESVLKLARVIGTGADVII